MTEDQARKTANVLLGAAAAAVAVAVLRSPERRRLLWRLAKELAAGPLAVYAATLVRNAWDEAGQAQRGSLR